MVIKLDDLVAEHLDHLHYLNDILHLSIEDLNQVLTEHLLNRLLIPLYIYSLILPPAQENCLEKPRIANIASLFLLSQVFLIISYEKLVQRLVDIMLNGNMDIFDKPEFAAPPETLEESLIQATKIDDKIKQEYNEENQIVSVEDVSLCDPSNQASTSHISVSEQMEENLSNSDLEINEASITDEEKAAAASNINKKCLNMKQECEKPFLDSIYTSLNCVNKTDDHTAVFALCLLYAMVNNIGK